MLYVGTKLVLARLSRSTWSIFSSLFKFQSCEGSRNKSTKYQKHQKYWSYCLWNLFEITNAYATDIE